MPATVALTGATGFIGGHLVRKLTAAGWSVRALVRRNATGLPANVTVVGGALDDAAAVATLVRDVDAVVHVAGLVKARNRAEFFRVNAAGAGAIAAAAAGQPKPPHVVLVSSLAAREEAISDYAASKRAGERAVVDAPSSLPWTIV